MAFFKKPFGRGEPAPRLPIHPEDQDLVSEADTAWWSTMTLNKLATMEKQDNASQVAIIIDQVDKGVSEENAVRHAMRSLPWHYGKLEDRQNKVLNFTSDDAGLPWILKVRVIDAVMAGKIKKQELEQSSSINASIRRLIRAGEI